MAILNFKKRFVPKINDGSKRQTIRAIRKYPIKPGEKLYLYTGLRTKYAEKICDVICKHVERIKIEFHEAGDKVTLWHKQENGKIRTMTIKRSFLDYFANDDGFDSWADMKAFWMENHPDTTSFKGHLISW